MTLAPPSAGFQSLPQLPTSKLGASCADSWLGGFVYVLCLCMTLWISPTNSPERLGVSLAASNPTGFFSQRF